MTGIEREVSRAQNKVSTALRDMVKCMVDSDSTIDAIDETLDIKMKETKNTAKMLVDQRETRKLAQKL